VCAFACTLFVCEDESLYAVGRPHTYNERWHDAYQSKRSWAAVNKPADCTDYKKVVASGSNFLILTKAGQLFCHGENLRLYFDSDVEKERATTEFVNCTDLFPVDDGDQIVDVAAGYFHTLAVTEGGSAYAVGLDKYRSYYTHIEGILDRKPAYQIELPGRAVACWAHKTTSVAWFAVEDDAGGRKMYSGCEFVDHYE
jgi:alpha-tubulin suppressor-like RCC1 family protein